MTTRYRQEESEIRRQSQELAVAWCRGHSAHVLDSLGAEQPLRAALVATLVYEALARWDPYDCKWPNSFRQALLGRSQGMMTADELLELEAEYRRRFGATPPRGELEGALARRREEIPELLTAHAERIRQALATGQPILQRRSDPPSMFLRPPPQSQG